MWIHDNKITHFIQSFIHDLHSIINDDEICSINYEAKASELLEKLEEMFTRQYMHSDTFSMFKSTAIH